MESGFQSKTNQVQVSHIGEPLLLTQGMDTSGKTDVDEQTTGWLFQGYFIFAKGRGEDYAVENMIKLG